jgi:hypothetical protein
LVGLLVSETVRTKQRLQRELRRNTDRLDDLVDELFPTNPSSAQEGAAMPNANAILLRTAAQAISEMTSPESVSAALDSARTRLLQLNVEQFVPPADTARTEGGEPLATDLPESLETVIERVSYLGRDHDRAMDLVRAALDCGGAQFSNAQTALGEIRHLYREAMQTIREVAADEQAGD